MRVCLLVVQVSTTFFRAYSWVWERIYDCPKRVYKTLAQIAREKKPEEIQTFLETESQKESITGFFMREFLALSEVQGHLFDIMGGAHVCLEDGGEIFELWSKHPQAHRRISSHPGLTWELGHCLFGEIERGGKKNTCFQFENTPLSEGFFSPVIHFIDYLRYKITGHQQGPAGSSPITDQQGLVFAIDVDPYSLNGYYARRETPDYIDVDPTDVEAPAV